MGSAATVLANLGDIGLSVATVGGRHPVAA